MRIVFLMVVLSLFATGPAKAATVSCNQTISAAGYYTLASSCTCTGNTACITVSANNVTLNLDNKTITCAPTNPPRATNETTFGVMASSVSNFTLMGAEPSVPQSTGKITGCYFGLHASYNSNMFVDRVDFSGNTYIGANTGYSTDVLLTRNVVNGIAGFVGASGHNGYAIAFNGCGTRCTLSHNVIRNIVRQPGAVAPVSGEGVGVILSANSTSAVMAHNWFENTDESTKNIGVWVASGSSATVENNSITGFYQAVSGPGTVSVNNNRLLMRNAGTHADSLAIYGTAGCAANNLIARYATAIGSMVGNCGGNIVYP